jgi:membrane associated rhomboid family serine protease
MIPLRDDIPSRRIPFVNYAFITINIVVFVFELLFVSDSQGFANTFALVPARFLNNPNLANIMTIFTGMFMHAGIAHIAGNMLYLWIFGDNVEDALGHRRYLVFYLLGGTVASLAHIFTNSTSTIPTVGASGAIAAVLGAYLILYPRSKVLTLLALGIFIRLETLPSILVLGLWFVLQLFQGFLSLGGPDVGGVAFWAHIGGFVFGMLMVNIFTHFKPRYYDLPRW